MRFWVKSASVVAVSVFTSIIVYPLLHEAGHITAALIIGYEIKEIGIDSALYIRFMADSNVLKVLFVTFGGMVLPVLVSWLIPGRCFYLWLIKTVIIATGAVVVLLSVLSVVLCIAGFDIRENDLISVAEFSSASVCICLVLSVLIEALLFYVLKSQRPFERMYIFLLK